MDARRARGRRAPDDSLSTTDARRPVSADADAGRDSAALAVRRAALGLLARREYASTELRERLVRKLGGEAPVDAELSRLAEEGLLDDARFVEAFVRMHRRKYHGPLRILHELAQRGIGAELAQAAVDPQDPGWIALARSWRERRFGGALPRAAADWQRQARQLQSRGFSAEQVRRALRVAED